MSESSFAGSASSEKRTLLLRATGRAVTLPVLLGFALFFPAGRIDWPSAWALILVYAGGIYLTDIWLIARHPGLARERLIIPRTAERWDRRIISAVNFLLIGVALPLAGLDRRFTWSPPLPAAVHAAGLILLAAMFLFTAWAMAANGFFSSAIRLQNDRGQTVVAGGPYRFLRHPGYLGMILQFLSIPFVLGTPATGLPVLVIAGMYVYRTRREDDFLRKELPGYAEYAGRVRDRMLPGIW